jgi:CHAD domain-containing protein
VAGGKWISNLKPTTPVADAARRVLTVRLSVVRDLLSLALHEADKDVEFVHQLRFSTRRARAALESFGCCLPSKIYKKARKELRRIRRAANEPRDWDVFLASLIQWRKGQERMQRAGLDSLFGYVMARRRS